MKPWVPLSIGALATGVGLVNLASASADLSGELGRAFTTQAVSALVAIAVGIAASRISLDTYKRMALPAWAIGCAGLIVVLIIGAVGGGARSWLLLGGSSFQPSEAMKVLVPLALAAELSTPRHSKVTRVIVVAGLINIPIALISMQPDMGAVMLVTLGSATILWLGGLKTRWFIGAGVAGLLAAPIAWASLFPYQQERILTFLDPLRDPTGTGYQTLQSQYAVAAGGWKGTGWFAGTQGRLGFLPEHETDFILAVIAEEWGVAGASVALFLLFALVFVGVAIAAQTKHRFTALLAAGLGGQLFWQVLVNAGGVLGVVPLTGVTLPFLSRGGSSLLIAWVTIGLLMACAATLGHGRALLRDPVALSLVRRPSKSAATQDG
ncbi:MAG: rod shape determining protein RodA [Myxococcota bacterium]